MRNETRSELLKCSWLKSRGSSWGREDGESEGSKALDRNSEEHKEMTGVQECTGGVHTCISTGEINIWEYEYLLDIEINGKV